MSITWKQIKLGFYLVGIIYFLFADYRVLIIWEILEVLMKLFVKYTRRNYCKNPAEYAESAKRGEERFEQNKDKYTMSDEEMLKWGKEGF